ncbi:MAG: ImmA/IrrE family metallo-endopeptidase [Salinimicrobium sediminis]|nr:ImmA/IrrE family metallo-endopeptidase [Salinimicrobium sediminis]
MMNLEIIEKKAIEVLENFDGKKAPINVEKIARMMGLEVIEDDLGENVSGVLFIRDGKGIIGYNPEENINATRKRFTIAHELGHYVMHRLENDVFVDNKQFRVEFNRDKRSSTGEVKHEREANAFAAALLMPKHLLQKEIEKMSFDLINEIEEDIIEALANKFKVSKQAMTYRMLNLRLY